MAQSGWCRGRLERTSQLGSLSAAGAVGCWGPGYFPAPRSPCPSAAGRVGPGPGSARPIPATDRRGAGPGTCPRAAPLRHVTRPGQGRGWAGGRESRQLRPTDRPRAGLTGGGAARPREESAAGGDAARGGRGGGAGNKRPGAPRRRDVERVGPRALAVPRRVWAAAASRDRMIRGVPAGSAPPPGGAVRPRPACRRADLQPGDSGGGVGSLSRGAGCEGWAADRPGVTASTPPRSSGAQVRRVGVWGRVCTTLGHAPRGETPSPPSQPVPQPPRLDELLESGVAGKEGLGLCQGGSQVEGRTSFWGSRSAEALRGVEWDRPAAWSGVAQIPGSGLVAPVAMSVQAIGSQGNCSSWPI